MLFLTSCGENLYIEQPIEQPKENTTVQEEIPQQIKNELSPQSSKIPIKINGLSGTQEAVITLKNISDSNINVVQKISAGTEFLYIDIPDGEYIVMAESSNKKIPAPQTIKVKNNAATETIFTFSKASKDTFEFHWESDLKGRDYEYTSNGAITNTINFTKTTTNVADNTAIDILRDEYNIILKDGTIPWTLDTSYRLLKTIQEIPHKQLKQAVTFEITKSSLKNDIQIISNNSRKTVFIDIKAFNYASPTLVRLNGENGWLFSKRLVQALLYFYTDYGRDKVAIEKILNDKFGLTTNVPNIEHLTGEDPRHFQEFNPFELIQLIKSLLEMPKGYYKIPGFRYLLRRLDGHPHPMYPGAPAVAWPRGANSDSYVEFMDIAFRNYSEEYIHRLVLHEKAHFLWKNVFTNYIIEDWIELGGWYENEGDSEGWSTTDTTGFVSAYAHGKNPNEDMAESLSHYILNPEKLLSVNADKYYFIERRIMNGYKYVSHFDPEARFEVLNLFPDYDYPGKIKRVDILVTGDNKSDKKVTIEFEMHNVEGIQDGASYAYTRIFSPNGTFTDVYFDKKNGNSHIFVAKTTIPKTAKSGYWYIDQINIYDDVGNRRSESAVDFGFRLFVNNLEEDITPPKYVANSLSMSKKDTQIDGRPIHNINVSWNIIEEGGMKKDGVLARLVNLDNNELYFIDNYGIVTMGILEANVSFNLTEYFPSGRYGVRFLSMQDIALNYGRQYFSDAADHEPSAFIYIHNENEDTIKPQLDKSRIMITAEPTNPKSPNGETIVKITFYTKDDKSGIQIVKYRLRDPKGSIHSFYHYEKGFRSLFPTSDPTVYQKHTASVLLPAGSTPGTWGLEEIILVDKATNQENFSFVENLHFQVERPEE